MQRHSIILFISLFLVSCTSTKVVSNKDQGYEGKIEKLYIISSVHPRLSTFEETFVQEFQLILFNNNIDAQYTLLEANENRLSLEDTGVGSAFEKAIEYDANLVLLFQMKEGTITRNAWGAGTGTTKEYVFDASLIDIETQNRVWRAEITTKGEEYTGQQKESRVMTQELVKKLVEDGLLDIQLATE